MWTFNYFVELFQSGTSFLSDPTCNQTSIPDWKYIWNAFLSRTWEYQTKESVVFCCGGIRINCFSRMTNVSINNLSAEIVYPSKSPSSKIRDFLFESWSVWWWIKAQHMHTRDIYNREVLIFRISTKEDSTCVTNKKMQPFECLLENSDFGALPDPTIALQNTSKQSHINARSCQI